MRFRPTLLLALVLGAAACETPKSTGNDSTGETLPTGPTGVVPTPVTPSPNAVVPAQTGGNAVSPNVPAGPTTPSVADVGSVHFLGRIDASSKIMSWPGTGIAAAFSGRSASAQLLGLSGNSWVGISVDGGNVTRQLVGTGATKVPISASSAGSHTVEIVKLNEASLGLLSFTSFTTTGAALPAPEARRRIEFIGDSITVGYGVEGTSPCTNNAALENAMKTYAAQASRTLGAEYDLIAWSGRGLMRNAASVQTSAINQAIVPELWLRATAHDPNSAYDFPASREPNAVVINLGTNDFTYIAYDSNGVSSSVRAPLDIAAYTAAYVAFVQQVRARYPQATIVMVSSPMLSDFYPTAAEAQHTAQLGALQAAASQLSDANVHVLDFPTMTVTAGLNGCDSHPSAAQHQDMARLLVAELKADLGW